MMNRHTEMNEEMMEMVVGGRTFGKSRTLAYEQNDDYDNGIHPGCGGTILNQGNIFARCRCSKCGETNYLYNDFFTWIDDDEYFSFD